MPKKKSNQAAASSKAAAKLAKQAKAARKVDRKELKKKSKGKKLDEEDSDNDLEGILDRMKREWEEAHVVIEETVEGPPSRRANATLTACPNGNHLWCIGGEFFSDDGKAHFYNDVYRYTPDKDEWRKFTSPTCPGPRSAHAMVSSAVGGGKLFLFGGEFSSLHQNTFHHYRDFWCFDISTHSWERIETKLKPSARSGHRMVMWKHFIVLFGGFYDPGIRTNYLSDLWLFDTQEYKWQQVEFRDDRRPSPRSGFSFIPIPDGVILYGGYCKEYVKGKRVQGIALDDMWLLRMNTDMKLIKWEKRKKVGYAPSPRSGCTMAMWSSKATGILFGGVHDEDRDEETLESVFYNDLYGYQTTGNGRWISLALKKPKKKPGSGQKMVSSPQWQEDVDYDEEDEVVSRPVQPSGPDADPNDPNLTIPLVRYNAMMAVLRNTLYIYGGIFERGSREYTLDDFYALPLDKLDRYMCLKESGIVVGDGDDESSDEDEDEDEDEDDSTGEDDSGDEEIEDKPVKDIEPNSSEDGPIQEESTAAATGMPDLDKDALRAQASTFLGVSRDSTRSAEDVISTPLPGETLAMFYARSREYWTQKAHESSDNRGKSLRRDGFALAEERYGTYKVILEEVEKILAEAGLDEEEMKRSALPGAGPSSTSRNRR